MKLFHVPLIALAFASRLWAGEERPNGDVGFNWATEPKAPLLDGMDKEGMIFSDFHLACAMRSGFRTAQEETSRETRRERTRQQP